MQELAKGLQAGEGIAKGINPISASEYAACRESAGTIVANELKKHEREATAWRWLNAAIAACPMTKEEEAALWDVLCRARRERF